jgi:hypothetical protein
LQLQPGEVGDPGDVLGGECHGENARGKQM